MAKILFLQNSYIDNLGVMWISSYLKSKGHKSEIIVETTANKITEKVGIYQPDIVAFSCMTGTHQWALSVARFLKKQFNVITVFGGAHATFYPEIIENPEVDVACISEGEYAMLDLANAVDRGQPITNILNFWVSNSGTIVKNATRPFINNLDELPFPDRMHYERYHYYKKMKIGYFIAGRGCPYPCSFCFNHYQMKLQKGKYVRMRSKENLIEEILEYKKTHPLDMVHFHDDTFIFNKKWLFDFLDDYKNRINIPFHCCVRADLVDEEMVRLLKDSNCNSVAFGIEHGNEMIRKTILKKNITNEQIIKAASLFRQYKIKFKTFSMVGLPGEKIEDAFETIRLNQIIKADYPWCSLFTPYPRTELGDYAIKNGFVKNNFSIDDIHPTYFEKTVINQDNIDKLVNLQKFFYISVKYPFLFKIVKKIIYVKNNSIFNYMFLVVHVYTQIYRLYDMKIFDVIRLMIASKKAIRDNSIE